MTVILHIAPRPEWESAKQAGSYRGDTLESEGFIHCCFPPQLATVANRWFPAQKGLILLCIDAEKVRSPIKYEGAEGGEQFPHIYGALNLDAVFKVLDFEPGEDGNFEGSEALNSVKC